VQLMLAHN